MSRYVKRGGKLWIRVFPDKPITKKPIEVRMGAGKGNVEYWVAQIQPGRMLYEIEGIPEDAGARGVPPGRREALREDHLRDPDGALMELKELRQKSDGRAAGRTCSSLQREQFSLRMQKATGQLAKTHDIRNVRREIARVKTAARPQKQGKRS